MGIALILAGFVAAALVIWMATANASSPMDYEQWPCEACGGHEDGCGYCGFTGVDPSVQGML